LDPRHKEGHGCLRIHQEAAAEPDHAVSSQGGPLSDGEDPGQFPPEHERPGFNQTGPTTHDDLPNNVREFGSSGVRVFDGSVVPLPSEQPNIRTLELSNALRPSGSRRLYHASHAGAIASCPAVPPLLRFSGSFALYFPASRFTFHPSRPVSRPPFSPALCFLPSASCPLPSTPLSVSPFHVSPFTLLPAHLPATGEA